MSSTQSRQPSGTPGGGRFASSKTHEASVQLGEPIWLKNRPETPPGGEDLLARYGAKPNDAGPDDAGPDDAGEAR